ncbi:hypothetical protein QJS10_CPA03g02316 [Acorus calamus]|uniref:DSBA-like thioredoxin domain-containing protein n=1 Tax=Acorus calamus TaxID=4465 RepID=A0AAV9F8H8_ACOCL|nr:hypothetical protein QJS10_CPA03g02316 [Acorus calamus]
MGRSIVHPLILFVLIAHLSIWTVNAQSSIPARYDGFVYGRAKEDSIVIEAFFDPICPDSRDSWPPLKRVIEDYSPHVSLIVHPFALPYHDSSFVSCRALHIANKLNESATYPLLELFFNKQGKYYNKPTLQMSRASVVTSMAQLMAEVVGDSFSAIKAGFEDPHTDRAARTSFKYGCSRGVYGTPFFFVNGFALPDGGSPIDYNKWKSIIAPLIGHRNKEEVLHFFL